MFKQGLFFVVTLFLTVSALGMPAQVILIRHGEKPEVGNELNERGWQRAYALPGFFKNNASVNAFGAPGAIYAMAPKGEDGSVRAIQTVTPYAHDLDKKIHSDFKKMEIENLVHEIKTASQYDGKMVLICWEHKVIPQIAEAFGLSNPQEWGKVYDRAWVLTFRGSRVVDFKNVPQRLLPGDSEQ